MLVFFPDAICYLLFAPFRYIDSEKRFQHVLEACGVNKSLIKLGVKEGDTVFVGDVSSDCFVIYPLDFCMLCFSTYFLFDLLLKFVGWE